MSTPRKPRRPRRVILYDDGYYAFGRSKLTEQRKKYLAVPLDPESVEAMIENAGNAIYRAYQKSDVIGTVDLARAALASLGITAGKRGRK